MSTYCIYTVLYIIYSTVYLHTAYLLYCISISMSYWTTAWAPRTQQTFHNFWRNVVSGVGRQQERRAVGWRPKRPRFSTAAASASFPPHFTFPNIELTTRAYVSVPRVPVRLHTSYSTHKHTAASHRKMQKQLTSTGLGNKAFFVFCSWSGDLEQHFLFPPQHQTSRKSATKSHGVFSYGYKWVARAPAHLLLLRVKSTALGVIH